MTFPFHPSSTGPLPLCRFNGLSLFSRKREEEAGFPNILLLCSVEFKKKSCTLFESEQGKKES